MANPAAALDQRATPSIISPVVDLLCVGGLSILLLLPLLVTGQRDLLLIGLGAQAWVATVLNMPHFMASYRMVYRSREMILRHPWASLWIPLLLLFYIVVAIWMAQFSTRMVTILVSVGSGYLAWHYTGQVWGMMASFAYLEGVGFDRTERLLVRGSLRVLLAWHVTWFVYHGFNLERLAPLYYTITAGTLVAFGIGAAGLLRMRKRIGRLPPLRALVAWVAIFVWYAAMARDPRALFWVQIFHALQYLEFPVRVEINRTARQAVNGASRLALHMAGYAAVLLGISWFIGMIVPPGVMDLIGASLGERPGQVAPVLILTFINIHHYFTDGVVWKISNPAVRQDLFAHVTPAAAVAPAGADGTRKTRRRRKR